MWTVRFLLDREDTDMTALVSSLVQLIFDDHCRTVEGFQDLVDREWIALGHPWVTRYSASSAEKVSSVEMLSHCTYSTSSVIVLNNVIVLDKFIGIVVIAKADFYGLYVLPGCRM